MSRKLKCSECGKFIKGNMVSKENECDCYIVTDTGKKDKKEMSDMDLEKLMHVTDAIMTNRQFPYSGSQDRIKVNLKPEAQEFWEGLCDLQGVAIHEQWNLLKSTGAVIDYTMRFINSLFGKGQAVAMLVNKKEKNRGHGGGRWDK